MSRLAPKPSQVGQRELERAGGPIGDENFAAVFVQAVDDDGVAAEVGFLWQGHVGQIGHVHEEVGWLARPESLFQLLLALPGTAGLNQLGLGPDPTAEIEEELIPPCRGERR